MSSLEKPPAVLGIAARAWRSPYPLLVLAALFWSGNFIVGRAVHLAVPPFTLAFWRWAGGSVLVLGVAWPQLRRDLPVLLERWPVVMLLSALGVAAYSALIYLGLRSTTAINALLTQSAMPLVILLCAFVLFGERPRMRQILGVFVSLAGVAVIVGRGSTSDILDLSFSVGDAWVLLAVLAYALYSALLRRRPIVHPLSFLAASFTTGAAMLFPPYLWERVAGAGMAASGGAVLAIGYLALFPSFLAYLFFNRGVELIGAGRAGQCMHLMPVFGSVLAMLFLGEAFHAYHAAGIALIVIGIGLAAIPGRRAIRPG